LLKKLTTTTETSTTADITILQTSVSSSPSPLWCRLSKMS